MSEKPAIIFITCDEMRLDTLSCYGGTAVDTPNIDSLMHQGTKYENCYTVSPLSACALFHADRAVSA